MDAKFLHTVILNAFLSMALILQNFPLLMALVLYIIICWFTNGMVRIHKFYDYEKKSI